MNSTYAPTFGANALPARSTNGFAIAAFVLSILGCFFLSFPFGLVALRQIKQRGEAGRGLAIASLVISALSMLAFAVVLVLSTATPVNG